METPENERETAESEPATKKRKRVGRKRSVFQKPPRPAWPVRGLWESAPAEERTRAHETCMTILEYWLGKKSKSEVASELAITPLRVWQLSQQALSGMMAGLLTQPRRRVGPEAFERKTGLSVGALRKRITELEGELSRTEDLVRVLRTAPWRSANGETPPHGGSRRARKTRRKEKARPGGDPAKRRTDPAGAKPLEGGASGAG